MTWALLALAWLAVGIGLGKWLKWAARPDPPQPTGWRLHWTHRRFRAFDVNHYLPSIEAVRQRYERDPAAELYVYGFWTHVLTFEHWTCPCASRSLREVRRMSLDLQAHLIAESRSRALVLGRDDRARINGEVSEELAAHRRRRSRRMMLNAAGAIAASWLLARWVF